MHHRTPLFAAALVLTLGLVACGDDDPAPQAATEVDGGGGDGPATVTVDIGDFVFDPTDVEVRVGDSVVWHNVHDQAHTATGNGDLTWNTDNLDPDATSEPVLFDEAGTYTYVCALHPFMEGTVEVSA